MNKQATVIAVLALVIGGVILAAQPEREERAAQIRAEAMAEQILQEQAAQAKIDAQHAIEDRCMELARERAAYRARFMDEERADIFNISRSHFEGQSFLSGDRLEMMNALGGWYRYEFRCHIKADGTAPQISIVQVK